MEGEGGGGSGQEGEEGGGGLGGVAARVRVSQTLGLAGHPLMGLLAH